MKNDKDCRYKAEIHSSWATAVTIIGVVWALAWSCNARAQDYGISHGYINSTRGNNTWMAEQKYAIGDSGGRTEISSSSIGREFFGFWANSIGTSIRHRYLDLPDRQFAVGHGLGFESRAIFESPLVNIGFFGGASVNSYRVPSLDNRKLSSVHSFGGVQLDRFWTYKLSFGVFARQGIERFDSDSHPKLGIQEAGFTVAFWDR